MLIVLIVISIILIILMCAEIIDSDLIIIPVGALGIKILVLSVLCWNLVECRVIDKKIELYNNQNKEIEEKVEIVVKEYMQHENNTFKGLKTDESYITLVTLYPELKADKLIQQEIDLYEENNNKIIDLKEKKINATIYKWWLYFGK